MHDWTKELESRLASLRLHPARDRDRQKPLLDAAPFQVRLEFLLVSVR
jgi:hypothetical protein